jgi:hypothetical protein
MREKTKSNKLQNQNSMASSSWLNRLKLDKLFLGKQISDEKIGFSLNLSHASSLFKTKPDSQSKATIKSMALAIGLAMLSCSALYQAPAKTNVKTGTQAKIQTKSQTQSLPGVFIADIDGRWQIPNQGEDGKLLGGVVCEGGYIGSQLIPAVKGVYIISCGFTLTASGTDTLNNKAMILSLTSGTSAVPVNSYGAWEYFDEIGTLELTIEYEAGLAVRINGQKIKLPKPKEDQ